MDGHEWLATRFEENRARLQGVAYRMLGSLSEADDAVQETWLRLSRSDTTEVKNLGGWLTTAVARVCLDMLRSRKSRREEPLSEHAPELTVSREGGTDPEREAVLADSVGLAVLVVLDRLAPAERIAFVLHEMFALPFDEIAPVVGRSPAAARQLASRARRRVRGPATVSTADRAQQRTIVEAFLAALHAGDFEGLVAVLDPDVVARVDEAATRPGGPREIRGARNWAKGAAAFSRSIPQGIRFVRPMLVDGAVGLAWAPNGRLLRALKFTIAHGKIVEVDVVADPERLRRLDLAVV
jgi:RNA polymerase sigma factor (sigma-70 family)